MKQELIFETSLRDGTPIIGVMSSGALIRLLAPALSDKHSEPPVLAVAEDGSSVVPLLGGHHGANDLARKIAAMLGKPCRRHHGGRPAFRRCAGRAA